MIIYSFSLLDFLCKADAANEGGQIAGNARRALERQTSQRVVSRSNHLPPKPEQDPLPASVD